MLCAIPSSSSSPTPLLDSVAYLDFPGTLSGPGMAGFLGQTISTTGVIASTIPLQSSASSFGSTPMSYGMSHLSFRPPNLMLGSPFSQLMSYPLRVPQPGLTIPPMRPQVAPPYLGAGMVQPSHLGGIPQVGHLGASIPLVRGGMSLQPHLVFGTGLGESTQKSNNPFLH